MSSPKASGFDSSKAEGFADRFVTALNNGALCLMVSIGHRTGLFDAMAELPPSTVTEIAKGSGMHERYIREWLGAMVTGKIVDLDPNSGLFRSRLSMRLF